MPTDLRPDVDVLIVNYKTGDLTRRAAEAVDGPGVRILIWDNSGDVTSIRPHWSLFQCGANINFAAGNNELFRRSTAEYVLLLNPDVVLSHESLYRLVARLESDRCAWGAIPRLVNPDGSDQHYYRRLPTYWSLIADRMPAMRTLLWRSWRRHIYADEDYRRTGRVEAPPAACLLLRRAVLPEDPALFDEQFPLFFNDTDLAAKLNRESGYCCYVGAESAVHLRGASLAQERKASPHAVARSYDESALRYASKYFGSILLLRAVIGLRAFGYRVRH